MTTDTGSNRRPFFFHPDPPAPSRYLDDATRRLCAATYLDNDYAHQVIEEITENEHRAVAPSLGFDLDPVVRHAFRARRMLLIRDVILAGLLVLGLVLLPGATVGWLLFGNGVRRWRAGSRSTAHWLVAAGVVVFCCTGGCSPLVIGPATVTSMLNPGTSAQSETLPGEAATQTFSLAGYWLVMLALIGVVLGTGAVLVCLRIVTFRTLTQDLAPGSAMPPPDLPDERTADRVEWARAAQYGNVSLHSQHPFMGGGRADHRWSVEVTLRGEESLDPRSISAQEIHHEVRQSIQRLADPSLPPRQRVPGVQLVDRIVADGERYRGDPLIDQRWLTPLAGASPEALVAVIEHPQGGVRHYLQILIGLEGKDVRYQNSLVIPAQPQDLVVSAYLHAAVEGGKLYVELIGAVLPPIQGRFGIVDRLRPEIGPMMTRVMSGLVGEWVDSVGSPIRVVRTLGQIWLARRRSQEHGHDVRVLRSYNYGARLSVRELAAEPVLPTFLQNLDAYKYLLIVQKTVFQSVLEYLESKGVDTSEYRKTVDHIENNYSFGNTTFNGPTAIGKNAKATAN